MSAVAIYTIYHIYHDILQWLFIIMSTGYEEIVSILLSGGADNSVRNNRGFTPYYEARVNRQFTVCNILTSQQHTYGE